MVDSRTGHGTHGDRSEEVRCESVSAIARCEKSAGGGRQFARQRVVPESNVDDHGTVLALLRLSGRANAQRGDLKVFDRRDLFKLGLGATLAHGAGKHRFFTDEEFAMVEELTEIIIPTDEKSGGAK